MDRLIVLCFLILVSSCRQSPNRVDIKTDIIYVQTIDNNPGGHQDIFFQILGLTDQSAFDSYFFARALEGSEKADNLAFGLTKLFEYWNEKTHVMHDKETVFLPIDFSDEYTGCLKVVKVGDSLNLTYGLSRIMGLNVNPLDPGNFFREVNDFEADPDNDITVHQRDWNKSLDTLIKELKNVR